MIIYMNKNILLIVIFSLIVFSLQAQIKCKGEKGMSSQTSSAAGCVAASASALMDINNVQAIYFNAGDMWWDMPNGESSLRGAQRFRKAFSFFWFNLDGWC